MRSVPSNTSTYLLAREGVNERIFVYFNSPQFENPIGFWNGHYDTSVDVISGETGAEVTRGYLGGGTLVSVDDFVLVTNLTINRFKIGLNGLNPDVINALRGNDFRLAHCEVHYGLLSLENNALIDPPLPHFVGQVNKAPIGTGTPGSENIISLEVVSRSRELTITNPQKKSDASQKLRGNDTFRKYAGTAHLWNITWGEAS